MVKPTLKQLYEAHDGKVSDKWSIYLAEYERIFLEYRELPIQLLEIGIQNGGSLEVWGKYFQQAQILVGCDINPDCTRLHYDDQRIAVVVGDANSDVVKNAILSRSSAFDIIIDDGSHRSSDIVRSFAKYFPYLRDGGVFVAEDLHCSYWQEFEGGLLDPFSCISFFKRLVDITNHEHWGIEKDRVNLLSSFSSKYGIQMQEEVLQQIHSIEFINSMCVIRKRPYAHNELGARFIAGQIEDVVQGHLGLTSTLNVPPVQNDNKWAKRNTTLDEELALCMDQYHDKKNNQKDIVAMLKENISMFQDDCLSATNLTVACVIPYFNGSAFIERALLSVYSQTIKPDEIIIVNDGSKADEAAFLEALANKYKFSLINKPNGGQGSARNAGVAASKSDFICFLDQDDFYLPKHIEILKNAIPLDDSLFGFAYADLYEADGDGNVVRTEMVKSHSSHPKRNLFELLNQDMFVLPSASIISRKAFDSVKGFDEQFTGYEDDDLFLRLFRSGYSNYYIDRPVTVWCIHADSTSYSFRMSLSRYRYFDKLANTFSDDTVKQRFPLRDCLMPRFGQTFLKEAYYSITSNDKHKSDYLEFFSKYVNQVESNNSVSLQVKRKLKLQLYVLKNLKPNILLFVYRVFATRLGNYFYRKIMA